MSEFTQPNDHDATIASTITSGPVPRIASMLRPVDAPGTSDTRPAADRTVIMQPPEDRGETPLASTSGRGRRVAAAGALGFALAACTTSAEPAEVAAMPPDIRFSHDYANGYPTGPISVRGHDTRASGQDNCLDYTPYDPLPPTKTEWYDTPGSVLIEPPREPGGRETIAVTVTNGDTTAPVLRFASPADSVDANGYPKPLTPLDDVTRQVLDQHGCVTDHYPRYKED